MRAGWCVLVALLSCSQGDPEIRLLPNDETPSPVIGRTVDLTTYEGGERMARESVVLGSDDPRINAMLEYLEGICTREARINERFGDGALEFGERYEGVRDLSCGPQGAAQQQILLCVGHKLMGMSEAVMPQDFVVDGRDIVLRQRQLVEENPAELPTPLLTIPVQDNASRATFAMWATLAFERAATAGAYLIDTTTCADRSLSVTLPSYASLRGEASEEAQRVPLGFVVASATSEAMHQMMDAAERGQTEVHAQAETLRSQAVDPADGVARSFRARTGSRLEAMSVYSRVPLRLMDSEPSEGLGTNLQLGEFLPCLPDIHRITEQFYRKYSVHPLDASRAERLRAAMEVDDPIFGTPAFAALSDDGFFRAIGSSSAEVEATGDALHQVSAATGRVLVPFESNGVSRVRGLTPQTDSTPAAFQYARTTGSSRVDHVMGTQHAPVATYGGFSVSGITQLDSEGYGNGPALETLDVVASALTYARARADMVEINQSSGDAFEFSEAVEVSDAARMFARSRVPMRTQTCVGRPTEEGVQQVRIRLYGADVDSFQNYDVWLGEAGLQCATSGRVEGAPCTREEHAVRSTAVSVRESAGRSGFEDRYVEILVDSETLPPAIAGGPVPTGHLYITDGAGNARRAVAAMDVSAGANSGEWSRCTFAPAGAAAMAEAVNSIQTSPRDCSKPIVDCAGVPFDQRVPLEDEIAEARGRLSGDDLDTSWEHALTLARQAADEADLLGQQLVQNGLEFDIRTEIASEAVSQICGVPVPVMHLPGSLGCATSANCEDVLGDGYLCAHGACYPESIETYFPDGLDPALESCLDPGDSTLATLGSREYCVWRKDGGAPCDGEDAALDGLQCPWFEQPDCTLPAAAEAAGFVAERTFALELFQETDPPANAELCNDLAYLVRNSYPTPPAEMGDRLEAIQTASWLNQAHVTGVAQYLRWMDGPLAFSGIKNADGSSGFASLGSFFYGPNDEWPCAPHPSMDLSLCDQTDTNFRPLGCGYQCNTLAGPIGREVASVELKRALSMMDALVSRQFGHHPITWTRPEPYQDRLYFGSVSAPEFDYHLNDSALCQMLGRPPGCQPSDAPWDAQVIGHIAHPGVFSLLVPSLTDIDTTYSSVDRVIRYGVNAWMIPGGDGGDPELRSTIGVPCNTECDADACVCQVSTSLATQDMWAGSDRLINEFLDRYATQSIIQQQHARYSDWNREGAILLDGSHLEIDRAFHHENGYAGGSSHWQPIRGGRMTNRDVLRGLELACYAVNSSGAGFDCGNATVPPTLNSLEDLDTLSSFTECQAKRFRRRAAAVVLADMPENLASQLRDGIISSTYPAYQGAIGEAMGGLHSELEGLPPAVAEIENGLRDIGVAISIAASELREANLHAEINDLQFMHSAVGHATSCAVATANAATIGKFGGAAAAAATCAGGVAQAMIEGQILAIQNQVTNEHVKQILLAAVQRMLEAADRMSQAEASFRQSIGRISAHLARIDSLRTQAESELSKALVYEEGAVGEGEYPVNSVMRTRLSTARIRYERAQENAVRLAWLAKRSIEQRFGVELDSMADEMLLVGPPKQWASRVCEMGGINYAEIRGELEGPIADYADEFVGDYVRQLELFVESYRLDFPTENGRDVAVVSLRDDVLRAHETCEVSGDNLLHDSAAMLRHWIPDCDATQRCPTVAYANSGPFRSRVDGFGNESPRRLGMADGLGIMSVCPESLIDGTAGHCTATSNGVLTQIRDMEGHYLLSWYEPITPVDDCEATCCAGGTCDEACIDACVDACALTHPAIDTATMAPHVPAVEAVVTGDGVAASPIIGTPQFEQVGDPWLDACRWRRAVMAIDVPERQEVSIGFRRPLTPSQLAQINAGPLRLAAPQLEEQTEAEAAALAPPTRFFPTDHDRVVPLAMCPDLDGDTFRAEHWRRDCEYVCPEGLAESCANAAYTDRDRLRCYWEARFHIGDDAIDRGDLFPSGGFAIGNFNHRHRTFAVNLVGVGVRDCATADNPGACYASGSVPFSLRHDGPYLVRNYEGSDVSAPLFVGNVEHARALTAERYLTNPLSGADRALMTDFWRDEFRGRPLSGAYTLRIYDAPGLQWDNVEDVQIVLNYGYWTRFE